MLLALASTPPDADPVPPPLFTTPMPTVLPERPVMSVNWPLPLISTRSYMLPMAILPNELAVKTPYRASPRRPTTPPLNRLMVRKLSFTPTTAGPSTVTPPNGRCAGPLPTPTCVDVPNGPGTNSDMAALLSRTVVLSMNNCS